jgi:hypothetical protein
MVCVPVVDYPQLEVIEHDLDIFTPFWNTAEALELQIETWMGQPFIELHPDDIIQQVKKWEEVLFNLKEELAGRESFMVQGREIQKRNHPLIPI